MSKKEENLVIIDADSLVYIIGYKFKNMFLRPMGISALDEFIKDILIKTRSKYYLGYFGKMGSKNFRYKIAKAKPYKGNRNREKEDYIKFWEPILKNHMEKVWGFVGVENIEADDACSIAAKSYKGKFNKVTVASPDKDLIQIEDVWFYDYKKIMTFYSSPTVANRSIYIQLIMGDTADNIPCCEGAGKDVAIKAYDNINKIDVEIIDKKFYIDEARKFYHNWYNVVLKERAIKKMEKEYLAKYKKENDIKRYTAAIKSEALSKFSPDLSDILKPENEINDRFDEMYYLLNLLESEKEGKKYGFILNEPIKDSFVDWEEILAYEENLDSIPDENENIDILDDI